MPQFTMLKKVRIQFLDPPFICISTKSNGVYSGPGSILHPISWKSFQ